VLGRLTATYRLSDIVALNVKASGEHDEQGGTSWNDRLWKCPAAGYSSFPGGTSLRCAEGFETVASSAILAISASTVVG
jgi:hypothetical protein